MGFFTCFGLPAKLRSDIQSIFSSQIIDRYCPYAVFLIITDVLLRLYENSERSIRNHVSRWEAVGFTFNICLLIAAALVHNGEGRERLTTPFYTRLRGAVCTSPRLWMRQYDRSMPYDNNQHHSRQQCTQILEQGRGSVWVLAPISPGLAWTVWCEQCPDPKWDHSCNFTTKSTYWIA